MRTGIIVNFAIEGLHHWPECPIEEVAYLKDKHRHTFCFTCKKLVSHDDRDTEIIIFKNTVRAYLRSKYGRSIEGIRECDFGSMSCEMLARELVERFDLYYCSVLEDNENGGEVVKTQAEIDYEAVKKQL